jgi:hypothetical protein
MGQAISTAWAARMRGPASAEPLPFLLRAGPAYVVARSAPLHRGRRDSLLGPGSGAGWSVSVVRSPRRRPLASDPADRQAPVDRISRCGRRRRRPRGWPVARRGSGRWRRWRGVPRGGDECVELRAHEVVVAQNQVEERVDGRRRHHCPPPTTGPAGRRTARPRRTRRQALMAFRSPVVTATLRGLACSATGIRSISTPLS